MHIAQATCSLFASECARRECTLHEHGFKLSYSTTIPRHSGLAGSSAIVTALLNCLLQWYGVEDAWPARERPTFVLRVEEKELGIAAGLMDRVAQVRTRCPCCHVPPSAASWRAFVVQPPCVRLTQLEAGDKAQSCRHALGVCRCTAAWST